MSAMFFTGDLPRKTNCVERLSKEDGIRRHTLPACAGLAMALRRLGSVPLLALTKRTDETA